MASEQFKNNAQTNLNGAITAGAASLTVVSASGFPSSAQYRIKIDSEILIVTAGAGTTTWTVTRGAEGTTAAEHSDQATVTQVLTAAECDQFAQVAGGQLGGTGQSPDVRGLRETGGPTLLTMGAVADGQTLARSGSSIVGLTLLPANALINGGFDFAQRQAPATLTTISDNKYSADRWKVTRQNADLQYQRVDTNGALETGITARFYGTFKKITNAGKFVVFQPLEGSVTFPLASRALLFQAKMKASAGKTVRMAILQLNSSGTIDTIPNPLVPTTWGSNGTDPTWATNIAVVGSAASKSVGTSWANFSISVTAPSNAKNLICAVWTDSQFSANDTLSITEAGLYDGSIALPWLPRLPQQELALSQRYFEKSYDLDTVPGTVTQIGSLAYRCSGAFNTARILQLFFKTEKRTNPTMTVYSTNSGTSGKLYNLTAGADRGAQFQQGGLFGAWWSHNDATSSADLAFLEGHWAADAEL